LRCSFDISKAFEDPHTRKPIYTVNLPYLFKRDQTRSIQAEIGGCYYLMQSRIRKTILFFKLITVQFHMTMMFYHILPLLFITLQ